MPESSLSTTTSSIVSKRRKVRLAGDHNTDDLLGQSIVIEMSRAERAGTGSLRVLFIFGSAAVVACARSFLRLAKQHRKPAFLRLLDGFVPVGWLQ